jgi:predicted CXXCH cytochrome family protein
MIRRLIMPALGLALWAGNAAAADSCLSSACHADLGALNFRHAPAAAGQCQACHTPLKQQHPVPKEQGFQLKATGAKLCAGCHQKVGQKRVVHDPVKGGECLSCHRPHGARGRRLLDQEGGELTGLCLGCHDAAGFKRKYVHGPVAEGACLACHDPHDAGEKGLLKDAGRKLCLSCHEEFAKGLHSAQRVHQPVRDKPCTSCHDPHSASFRYLLRKKMPELCVDCHKELLSLIHI